jgi:hypothetical protein
VRRRRGKLAGRLRLAPRRPPRALLGARQDHEPRAPRALAIAGWAVSLTAASVAVIGCLDGMLPTTKRTRDQQRNQHERHAELVRQPCLSVLRGATELRAQVADAVTEARTRLLRARRLHRPIERDGHPALSRKLSRFPGGGEASRPPGPSRLTPYPTYPESGGKVCKDMYNHASSRTVERALPYWSSVLSWAQGRGGVVVNKPLAKRGCLRRCAAGQLAYLRTQLEWACGSYFMPPYCHASPARSSGRGFAGW